MDMMLAAIAILILGLTLRLRYLRLPLDWDHGLLLYQSYWYTKLGKFIAGWYDYVPDSRANQRIPTIIEENSMIRYQTLGFSFINIINYLICRDKVWAYRLLDAFYSLLVTAVIFLWGSLLFDSTSAALGASLFFLFSSMPFFWAAMDNPEKHQILFTTSALLSVTLFMQTSNYIYCILAGIFFFISMTFKQNLGFVILCTLIFMVIYNGFIAACSIAATLLICYICLFSYYCAKGYPFKVIFGGVFVSIDAFYYLYNIKINEEGKFQKSGKVNFIERITPNLKKILKESSLLWVMSLLWFIHTAITSPGSYTLHLLILVLAGSLLAFMAANKYFPYYYIPFLPILALTSGNMYYRVFTSKDLLSFEGMGIVIITTALSILGTITTFRFFFRSTPFDQGAYMYSNTLYNFGTSEEIGRHIRAKTDPDEYIYVYNLNPEIYFFAQRRCPTNTLYIDNLTTSAYTPEDLKRFEQAIRDKLKAASPAYFVINKTSGTPIGFFESVTGNKYFLEKEYHAGFDADHNPVTLQMFKVRKLSDAKKSVDAGEELFGQNKILDAIQTFQKAIEFDPLNSDALNNLGVCYFQQKDHMKAVEYFVKAFEANPSNRDTVLNLLHMDLPVQDKFKLLQLYLAFNPNDAEMKLIRENLS